MIEISEAKDRCFARLRSGNCMILSRQENCNPKCAFYKPEGCEDWVRYENKNGIWLIPPEELLKKRKGVK